MTPDDLDYVLRRPTEASFAFVKREESITFLLSHISHCLFSRVCLLGIHVFTHARSDARWPGAILLYQDECLFRDRV